MPPRGSFPEGSTAPRGSKKPRRGLSWSGGGLRGSDLDPTRGLMTLHIKYSPAEPPGASTGDYVGYLWAESGSGGFYKYPFPPSARQDTNDEGDLFIVLSKTAKRM